MKKTLCGPLRRKLCEVDIQFRVTSKEFNEAWEMYIRVGDEYGSNRALSIAWV